jgi:hypothetical protein
MYLLDLLRIYVLIIVKIARNINTHKGRISYTVGNRNMDLNCSRINILLSVSLIN